MLSLEMLAAAIGMIFIYLLISLICSAINEFVESNLKMRAVDLEQGIRQLLSDKPSNTKATAGQSIDPSLTKQLYDHPLIFSLFKGNYDKSKVTNDRYSIQSNLPSYIPAKNFGLALMDVLAPAKPPTAEVSGNENGQQTIPASNGTLSGTQGAISTVKTQTINPLKNFRDQICKINNAQLQSALLTIIDAAGDAVTKAREGIESWYNSTMDRVSGWCTRRTKTIVFCLGFAIAMLMNADSIAIFNNLVNDRPLRNAVVATALQGKQSLKDTTAESLRKNINGVVELGLPIGWNWKSQLYDSKTARSNLNVIPEFELSSFFSSTSNWLLKILGWVIMGFAVSLGASFWFDTLNKVMIIRSTVKPHEKSPEETSQDRKS